MKNKRVFILVLLLAGILIFSSVSVSAFWPFDLFKKIINSATGNVVNTGYGKISTTSSLVSNTISLRPLIIKDITNASRNIVLSTGITEYFSAGSPNNLVYLIGAGNTYTYDYAGKFYLGNLLVYHTFGAKSSVPFSVNVTYIDSENKKKILTVYFPAFDTSSGYGTKKMYFYITEDGSSYYADAENDGINDERELLEISTALQNKHLARAAPQGNEAIFIEIVGLNLSSSTFDNSISVINSGYGLWNCSESDKGVNFYVKSYLKDKYVSSFPNGIILDTCATKNIPEDGVSTYVDYCNGDNCFVFDYYCVGNGHEMEYFQCPNGCYNGACVKNATETRICKDGTLYGKCTEEKPFYCNEGNLVKDCVSCGCKEEQVCNFEKGSCRERPPTKINEIYFYPFKTPSMPPKFDEIQTLGNVFNMRFSLTPEDALLKNAKFEISLKGKVIFSKNLDCNDVSSCYAEWLPIDVPFSREDYLITVSIEDNFGNKSSMSKMFSIEFKDPTNRSLCQELIPGHNDASANRANIVFEGFIGNVSKLANPFCDDAIYEYCLSLQKGYNGKIVKEFDIYSRKIIFNCVISSIEDLSSWTLEKSDAYSVDISVLHSINPSCEFIEKSPEEITKEIAKYLIDFSGQHKSLFSVEPFKSNKNKFNFWYINKTSSLAKCVDTDCSEDESLADNCVVPNKYVVYLINKEFRSNAGGKIRLSTPIYLAEAPYSIGVESTFVHEFGHQFGGLVDEYIEYPDNNLDKWDSSKYGEINYNNCYAGQLQTKEECLQNAQWKSMIGNGCGKEGVVDCARGDANYNIEINCFESCYYYPFGIYRNSFNNIMRSEDIEPFSFGQWNEKLIKDELNKFTG